MAGLVFAAMCGMRIPQQLDWSQYK